MTTNPRDQEQIHNIIIIKNLENPVSFDSFSILFRFFFDSFSILFRFFFDSFSILFRSYFIHETEKEDKIPGTKSRLDDHLTAEDKPGDGVVPPF
jgi:hypothetical protein